MEGEGGDGKGKLKVESEGNRVENGGWNGMVLGRGSYR